MLLNEASPITIDRNRALRGRMVEIDNLRMNVALTLILDLGG